MGAHTSVPLRRSTEETHVFNLLGLNEDSIPNMLKHLHDDHVLLYVSSVCRTWYRLAGTVWKERLEKISDTPPVPSEKTVTEDNATLVDESYWKMLYFTARNSHFDYRPISWIVRKLQMDEKLRESHSKHFRNTLVYVYTSSHTAKDDILNSLKSINWSTNIPSEFATIHEPTTTTIFPQNQMQAEIPVGNSKIFNISRKVKFHATISVMAPIEKDTTKTKTTFLKYIIPHITQNFR